MHDATLNSAAGANAAEVTGSLLGCCGFPDSQTQVGEQKPTSRGVGGMIKATD
jgi:hypothetical protein